MSRERATPAPTGLKTIRITHLPAEKPQTFVFGARSLPGTTDSTSPAPTGLTSKIIIPYFADGRKICRNFNV